MNVYELPHKFTIEAAGDEAGGYVLKCNGNFSFWAATVDEVFIAYGQHLLHGRG